MSIGRARFLVASLNIVLLGLLGTQQLGTNVWSQMFLQNQTKIALSAFMPPSSHDRALLWMANQAYLNDEHELAHTFWASSAEAHSRFGLQIQGKILLAQNEVPKALEAWRDAADFYSTLDASNAMVTAQQYDDASLAFESLYDIDSERGTLHYAQFLWDHADRTATAVAVLENSLEEHPISAHRASWLHQLGAYLYAENQCAEAETIYLLLLDEASEDWQAYVDLGAGRYACDGDAAKAILTFQQAIEADPTRADGYYLIAQTLVSENQYAEADQWFEGAIKRRPDARGWWIARAKAATLSNNSDLAKGIYEEAVEFFPSWAPLFYAAAQDFTSFGLYSEAILSVEQAILLSEEPSDTYYVLAGQIYELSEESEKAIQAYKIALELAPDNVVAKQLLQTLEGR